MSRERKESIGLHTWIGYLYSFPLIHSFPDQEYFRSDKVQNRMTDVLFVYAKVNSGLSYKQGMHELLAPIMMVIDGDSRDTLDIADFANGEDDPYDIDE